MTLTTRLVVLALLIAGGRSFIPGASTARRAVPRYAAIPSDDAASVARALLGGSAVVAPRAPALAPPSRSGKGRLARGVDAVRSRVTSRRRGAASRSADLFHVDDEAALRRLVLARNGRHVVLVGAGNCPACAKVEPTFARLAREHRAAGSPAASDIRFVHVDVTPSRGRLARALGITALPHFQLYADGEMVDEFSTLSKAEISDAVQKLIENTN